MNVRAAIDETRSFGRVSMIELVFVHSYSSSSENWQEVMVGTEGRQGRITRASNLAMEFSVPLLADDLRDAGNHALFQRYGIENLGTAVCTRDEVRAALARSSTGAVLFVSSPDHLPRVTRDVLACGGAKSLFAASDVAFSSGGAAAVRIDEPPHRRENNGR